MIYVLKLNPAFFGSLWNQCQLNIKSTQQQERNFYITYTLAVFPSFPMIMLYSLRMSVLKEPRRLSNFSVISDDISCKVRSKQWVKWVSVKLIWICTVAEMMYMYELNNKASFLHVKLKMNICSIVHFLLKWSLNFNEQTTTAILKQLTVIRIGSRAYTHQRFLGAEQVLPHGDTNIMYQFGGKSFLCNTSHYL